MTMEEFVTKWKPVMTARFGDAEDPRFARDCRDMGFEMDSGKSLAAAYPGEDICRADLFQNTIHTINDRKFLGSAIFSYWRYLTHWHNAPPPHDAKRWFAIAFDRLLELDKVES